MRLLAVDEHRGRALAGAGQADADVGMLALARAIDDAAHHRDVHALYTRIAALPDRHLLAQPGLDAVGQFLEQSAGGPAASRAGGDLWGEGAQAQRLKHLLAGHDLVGARLVRARGQRGADRVADAFLQQ